jgi:drug/metabolite transporter (DMT)-like permease
MEGRVKASRISFLTALAMIAFATNSLLCRAALKQERIDAASFTSIRILAGALMLWIILRVRGGGAGSGNWFSALALFVYAAAFSFAYVSLPAAAGALLLFAAVQATMITTGVVRGEGMRAIQWCGVAVAFAGLVLLLAPGWSAPPVFGSVLMLLAGVAWGTYSLRGTHTGDPAIATAGNFMRAVPMTVLLSLALIMATHVDTTGLMCAVISGAITSGLGYIVWYAVLPELKATTAATVQLSVPVLAGLGGILFLGEAMTFRFLIAAVAVLGGIALVLIEKR